jgi:tetraacyldisaccharide 4'-kinase
MLARVAPTIAAVDRVQGAEAACAAGASVIVMDDGFQNPSLVKDLAILVVDGRRGIGNGRVFPAGPLRAPLDRQLRRAQAMLVVGAATGAESLVGLAQKTGLRIFRGRLAPDRDVVAALAGHKVLAFAGIGDPDKFFLTLEQAGIEAPVRRAFADHHRYAAVEAAFLLAEADRQGLVPVTTEKDVMRLSGSPDLAELARRAKALPVSLVLDEPQEFRKCFLDALSGAGL